VSIAVTLLEVSAGRRDRGKGIGATRRPAASPASAEPGRPPEKHGALRPASLQSMIYSYLSNGAPLMSNAVKKTISLPADLAQQAEALAQAEGKTLSGVIQDALRQAGIERRLQELSGMQAFWSRKARDKGILTEKDLARYLGN